MSSRPYDFEALESWVEPLLQHMTPVARKALTRTLAIGLRRRQAARIRAQKNPDGSAFESRKGRSKEEVRFVYRNEMDEQSEPRLVQWERDGPYIEGFNLVKKKYQTYFKRRVVEFLDYRKNSIRGGVEMFAKLRQARRLKAVSDADGAAVGFRGKDAVVARIHQEGKVGQVGRKGASHKYPERRILGLTQDDRVWVMEQLAEHFLE